MILILQLLTVLGFGIIAFQDVKERMVHWVLFPICGTLLALLHWENSSLEFFLFSVASNFFVVSVLLLLLWMYTRLLRKTRFLNTSFGLGDILFLYAFSLGFPPMTFIVLLACSICFSLLAFIILNYFKREETVPLAGFMGIFLMFILVTNVFTTGFSLYLI